AIVVPAWNEDLVIGTTIDRLVSMDYPDGALRVYVVDDASTDGTPDVVKAKEIEYPGKVFHVRRDKGGEGKAHTLNHGLKQILAEDWSEAILIIDADVIFEKDALRKMARHLADPEVGAVTAYIKEGTRPGNFMTRFIGFEYITAQAASRRAQNVMGTLFCLAGGAQLHSRASLEAIGGRIDTSSLAEDTFTTFNTQLAGRKVHFEGNATVWAEEPFDIVGLWKQRLRWARGNVQLTQRFWHIWFRPSKHAGLGSPVFGFIWFSIFLMPVLMVLATTGLVGLYFLDFPLSWRLFQMFWIIHAITYLFVTLMSFGIDLDTAKHTWVEGFLFPGVIATVIIIYSCFPPLFEVYLANGLYAIGLPPGESAVRVIILFMYLWLTLGMVAAWGAKNLEGTPLARMVPALIYIVGYGPLLCAVTFASYIYEARGAEMKWDKTVKTGKVNA
ncbi:MAG: glycosyltransferase family 2 protein, partial [Rhodothermales bacterium]|nr:glycosyltransferase family 2 protein [Rhodothermales bacterium]